MKVIQMPPVHAANLVANSGNTAYGVDVVAPVSLKQPWMIWVKITSTKPQQNTTKCNSKLHVEFLGCKLYHRVHLRIFA